MISHAQNAEDVVLARAFPGAEGTYVDVGAASPTFHSVTKAFYDRGWRGMNIDPLPLWGAQLEAERPLDINLCLGVSDAEGVLDLLEPPDSAAGQATFAPSVAAALETAGSPCVVEQVPVRTLASLLDEHALGPIDFLKIDVEGWELQVIRGNDWARHRPRALVVEATEPGTSNPSHEPWEPILLEAGYVLCLFDGLNRFYALAEETELIARLSVPASVVDGYERADVVALQQRVADLEQELHRLEVTLRATSEEVRRAVARADDADLQFRAARLALEAAIAGS